MKRFAYPLAVLCLIAWTVSAQNPALAPALSTLNSQLSTNQVLALDGNDSYVELPNAVFESLDDATVEGWIKWERFQSHSRFFDFGEPSRSIAVKNQFVGGTLVFDTVPDASTVNQYQITVPRLLQLNRWCHIAAVSGKQGMKLYFNGVLLGTNAHTGSFSSVQPRQPKSYLGKSAWMNGVYPDAFFRGQMDEVRVWKVERTESEIRENMYKRLTGKEAALVGLWDFERIENGLVKDSGPNGFDGKLIGHAKAVPAQLPSSAQSGRLEKVLELDGNGSYVELPQNIFNDLAESTVEGWVKWDVFGAYSRFFDFGAEGNAVYVATLAQTPGIRFAVRVASPNVGPVINLERILRTGEWCHIAAVTGASGMKFYLNGTLIASNGATETFANLRKDGRNYLGHSNWLRDANPDFRGQMDEIRVWKVARTQEQIRANMFNNLTGQVEGLIGLWNFDDGAVQDASTNAHHGKLVGNAKVVEARRPSGFELIQPSTLSGLVTDGQGQPVQGARVVLETAGESVAQTTTDSAGGYRFVIFPKSETYDLSATSSSLGAWKLDLIIASGTQERIDLVLKTVATISGTVTALDGSPQPGFPIQAVEVRADDGAVSETGPRKERVVTVLADQTGQYRLVNLKPRRYRVRCQIPGGSVAWNNGAVVVLEPEKQLTGVDFRFAPVKRGTWKQFTYADGLVDDRVRCAHMDADGAIWFGTDNGVSRFDGKEFFNLTKEDGLADNQVWSIAQDREGGIWFGTRHGVSRYLNGGFVHHPAETRLKGEFVFAVCADPNGDVWFGTLQNGAFRYDGSQLTHFTTADGLAANFVMSITRTHSGRLWFGTQAGPSRYDDGHFTSFTANNGYRGGPVRGIDEAPDGSTWFASPGSGDRNLAGAYRFDGSAFHRISRTDGLADDFVFSVQCRPDSQVWLGTRDGISLHDGGSSLNFTTGVNGAALGGAAVTAIQTDPEGNWWFATDGHGVWRYDEKTFAHYTTADGMPSNFVLAGLAAHGSQAKDGASPATPPTEAGGIGTVRTAKSLWFGLNPGAVQFEGTNLTAFTAEQFGVGDTVWSLAESREGAVWFGFPYGGITRWDGRRFNRLVGLAGPQTFGMARDRDGVMWIANGRDGLATYDGKKTTNIPLTRTLLTNNLTSVHCDVSGVVWIGSEGSGIARYDGKQFQRFTTENGLADNAVNVIGSDPDGTVWIGTGSGLSRYDGKEFINYSRAKDRLGGSVVFAIYRDAQGVHWFGTQDGVTRFDGNVWSPLSIRDGLSGYQVRAILEEPPGVYWFGTDKGITRYEPKKREAPAPKLSVQLDQEFTDLSALPSILQSRLVTFKFNTVDTLTRGEVRRYRWRIVEGRATAARLASDAPAKPQRVDLNQPQKNAKSAKVRTDSTPSLTFPGLPDADNRDAVERVLTRFSGAAFLAAAMPAIDGVSSSQGKGGEWQPAGKESQIEWRPETPGTFTFAVQYIDRDLNYSKPVLATLTVVPPWFANAWITLPAAGALAGLLAWSLFLTAQHKKNRREAERLRERLFVEERKAREAAEAAKNASDTANQAKSQFLANMSHELRTPLNAIIGYSEMLQEEAQDLGNQELLPDLEKIHGAGKHLLGLINDILDLSKIEAGKMTLFLESFDVAQLVREVEATVRPLVARKENRLEVECPEDIGNMRADQTKVRQVLFNLLSNASKFTSQGKIRLEVGTRSTASVESGHGRTPAAEEKSGTEWNPSLPKLITFCVRDTGIGMTPEQVGNLFQTFMQADASTTKKFGGTGLGLAISKKFCLMMGGDLTVASEYGRGSTFTAQLPIEAEESKPDSAETRSALGAPGESATTILVIDDDRTVQDLMQRQLGKEGYRVAIASNSEQGLRLARELQPAVITLDVLLPGQDGWSVLSALKSDPALAEIPVIMMTVVDEKQMGFALGAADYLTKPIDWDRLSAVLNRFRKEHGQSVLVVEDDPATREMLERMLGKAGWGVALAENGKVGLARVQTEIPSLILLDLMMPEMDGFEFMRELRGTQEWQTIPVIVITAKELSAEERRRLNGQVERIIQKGAYRLEEVVEEVRRTLARRHQEAQLRLPLTDESKRPS